MLNAQDPRNLDRGPEEPTPPSRGLGYAGFHPAPPTEAPPVDEPPAADPPPSSEWTAERSGALVVLTHKTGPNRFHILHLSEKSAWELLGALYDLLDPEPVFDPHT